MKQQYLRLYLSLLFYCMAFFSANAQFSEDFSDGNFSTNPAWSGETAKFMINGSRQLQLNGPNSTDTAYLSAPYTVLNDLEWRFFLRLAFSPSGSNYVRVYLCSDKASLEGPLNGYFLKIGVAGSADGIELFSQQGTGITKIFDGKAGRAANTNNTLGIKVTRSSTGLWRIYSDSLGGQDYEAEGSVPHSNIPPSGNFGLSCTYTSGNRTKFYLDDIFITTIQIDTSKPRLLSASPYGHNNVALLFNEAISLSSIRILSNYLGNNGLGQPISASRDPGNSSKIMLSFSQNFQDSYQYSIRVSGLTDLAGNSIDTGGSATFIFTIPATPALHDVVFTEFMPDPDPPVGMPGREFVEIYNRTQKPFPLDNWTIRDDGGAVGFLSHGTIYPGEYLIVCAFTDTSFFRPFGKTIGVNTLPGLNNDMDTFTLSDSSGALIDRVSYNTQWMRDAAKDNGGWSLERIDPDFQCPNALNWRACKDSRGATAGSRNSIHGIFIDSLKPKLVHAFAAAPYSVALFFSKQMDSSSVAAAQAYTISPEIGKPFAANVATSLSSEVQLSINSPLQKGKLYSIEVSDSLRDCPNNKMDSRFTRARLALAESLDSTGVSINELLYDPYSEEPDFIELVNTSTKTFNLRDILIGNGEDSHSSSALDRLFFPADHLAFTEDKEKLCKRYRCAIDNVLEVDDLVSFNNGEGSVVVESVSRLKIDRFNYSDKLHFPLLKDKEGISLEKINPMAASQDVASWHSAAEQSGGATPGYRNSQYMHAFAGKDPLSLSSEVFSPDNDGYQDQLVFSYSLEEVSLVGNATVFDAQGRQIKELLNNELLGESGSFSWDGITESRGKAYVGIYILFFETFNRSGAVKQYKKTFSIVSRVN